MALHWYAIEDEPWQPLLAPEGQEMVVLSAVAQALPDQWIRLAAGPEKRPIASYLVRSASREHVVQLFPSEEDRLN